MQWDEITPAIGGNAINYISADTEAYTLIDGVRVSSADLLTLGCEKSAAWFREHVTVDVYAWLISNGTHTACFETWEAFADFCAAHRVGCVWWYNAKYDFAHIDYQLLMSGWTLKDRGKLTDRTYKSLHGRQGQRYCLTVGKEYKAADRHKYTHITRHYDLCNIFGGGLAKNLEAFNVTDFDGNPIRKLEMDYQGDDPEKMRAYMNNDVHGLYHLVRLCDTFLYDKWQYNLAVKKPDVMTAGGLAKKILLSYCNGFCRDAKENVKAFQAWHKVTPETDYYYRAHGLYRGGITLVNVRYQNRHLHGKPIYKYDINSMYPYQMSIMPDLIGRPAVFTYERWKNYPFKSDNVAVYHVKTAYGELKENALPVFYDLLRNEYTPHIEIDGNNISYLFFSFEWDELNKWYDITAEIDTVYVFKKAPAHGFRQFVEDNYNLKREGKKTGNKIMEAFAKLLLNSSYGKLSESPWKDLSHREINPETGAVTLMEDGKKLDENVILSVVVGAQITSMARCQLLRLIRETCPNPARDFIYCDTDSIIAFTQYPNPDPYTLGALKDETVKNGVSIPFTDAKFLAPKTYLLYRIIDGEPKIEVHTKGIPPRAVIGTEPHQINETLPVKTIMARFAAGKQFIALSAMNVRGGKALVPIKKYLCRTENTIIVGDQEHPETLTIMEEA